MQREPTANFFHEFIAFFLCKYMKVKWNFKKSLGVYTENKITDTVVMEIGFVFTKFANMKFMLYY